LLLSCIECGKTFAPVSSRQKFCSRNCCDRFKKRKIKLARKEKGLCPECGGPMDYPIRIGKGKSTRKQKISYCSRCRDKWRQSHRRKYAASRQESGANKTGV